MKKYLFFIFLICFLVSPINNVYGCETGSGPLCLNLSYPSFGGLDINDNQELTEIIAWFYYFIVGIAGFATFVMLVYGGFRWLTSAGNPSSVTDAKDIITKALLGLLLIFLSWLILQTINPELTNLTLPTL